MIYFVQAREGGPIKIGTTVRLTDRLKALAKESGGELRVLAVMDGGRVGELALHRRFAHLRAVGEWFEPGDDLLGFIVIEGREWFGMDDEPLMAVKMDVQVVARCKIAAAFAGISLAEYLSETMRDIAEAHIEKGYAEGAKGKAPAARTKKAK